MGKFDIVKIDFEKHPIYRRVLDVEGFKLLDESGYEAMYAEEGVKMVVLADDPNRTKESLDIIVIAPELRKCVAELVTAAYLIHPSKARSFSAHWGVRKLPAVAFFRGPTYLGAAEGLLNWDEYVAKIFEVLSRTEAPRRTIGIVSAAEPGDGCH